MAVGQDNDRDLKAALDALESDVEGRVSARKLAPKVEQLLETLPDNSPHRPRALRLDGALKNRKVTPKEALETLGLAKRLAFDQQDCVELSHIDRESSVVHAWRGADRDAALHLLHALAMADLQGDRHAAALALAEVGRIELEARRFAQAAMFFKLVVDKAADDDLPPRLTYHLKVNLCQALNRLEKYDEALSLTRALKAQPPCDDERLEFLTVLEEARALAGSGQAVDAENLLAATEQTIEKGSFESLELNEARAEIELLRGSRDAVTDLETLANEYTYQRLVVRAANLRMMMAEALSKQGDPERSKEALATALRSAVEHHLPEFADRIRQAMLESQAGGDTWQFQGTLRDIEEIGGDTTLSRRFAYIGESKKGGFGEVFRVVDLEDGQEVALKRMSFSRYSQARREHIVTSVFNEYGVARSLKTMQGVARVRDLLIDPAGTIYVVQDFIDGKSLEDLYDKTRPSELVMIMSHIADVLADLHEGGIVHRDLKPGNVLVCKGDCEGRRCPVLVDFGIALMIDKPDALPGFGTVDYMAPEQMRGEKVDERADVYSLGKMIAKIWRADDLERSTILRFWRDTTPPSMPREIRRLAKCMLQASPRRRPADLKEVAKTLRDWSLSQVSFGQ